MNMNIVNKFLPSQCYTAVNTKKTRICLHHTVSSPLSIDGDIATWSATRNVATHYIIGHDGTIFQCIPENYWAHHLGIRRADNTQLNKETIGIEIDAWGPLTLSGNKYMTAYGKEMDGSLPVEELYQPFRGYSYFQKDLAAQIDALYMLILNLSIEHDIPRAGLNKTLNFELLNDFSAAGIYSHTNFRADKSDVYPARYLIAMLKIL